MTIADIARNYIGQKEKPSNTGFYDSEFEKKMREISAWQAGWSWCAGAIEVWATEAFPARRNEFKDIFVPSAVNTFRNLVRAGFKSSMVPTVGSIVTWQRMEDGQPQWRGHIGVVSQVVSETEFYSIEGNASNSGSANGDGVYEVHRRIKPDVKEGLKVIGFVTI